MMADSEKRYGFVGILVADRDDASPVIQDILTDYGDIILGRMGLPHLSDNKLSIITLIVHATTDQVGSLTGRLGRIPGVSVKSGLGKI
ncbi:MAG: CopG family transcriptional regulator [Spirochaetales bacterium]|nr:CopG family transcriptional regulator [Spirochaetales bacterium]